MHGLGWELFVKHTSLHGAVVLLVFTTTGPKPRISVAFTKHGNNEEDSEEDYDSSGYYSDSSFGSDEGASYIVFRRVHLKTHENDHLVHLLPVKADVGVPFVTRLTTINLKRHDMVYMCLFSKLKIQEELPLYPVYMTLS